MEHRYISLYFRSRAPTARLKLKGISTDIHVHSEDIKYIVLKKKSKTKLVLSADSSTEFDGWLKTLDTEIKRQDELPSLQKSESNGNVDVSDTSERGRGLTRVKTKTPVPTPRTRTPSRETAREMVSTRTADRSQESSSTSCNQQQIKEKTSQVRQI